MKWVLGATGEIIIARNPTPISEPAELRPTLIGYIDNSSYPGVRRGAVEELGRLLRNRNRAVAMAADVKLKELLEDDSLTIRKMAEGFLAEKARRDEEERSVRPRPSGRARKMKKHADAASPPEKLSRSDRNWNC